MEWMSGEITIANGSIETEAIKVHIEGTGTIEASIISEKKEKTKTVKITDSGVKSISLNNNGRGITIKLKVKDGNLTIRKVYLEYDIDED